MREPRITPFLLPFLLLPQCLVMANCVAADRARLPSSDDEMVEPEDDDQPEGARAPDEASPSDARPSASQDGEAREGAGPAADDRKGAAAPADAAGGSPKVVAVDARGRPAGDDAAPPGQPTPGNARPLYPGELLDLKRWKLQLPIDTRGRGTPDEVKQPELDTREHAPFFQLTERRDGVAFRAPAGGATTRGTHYPRTELREMAPDGRAKAAWSTSAGTHSMTIRQAITRVPEIKPHVVAGQIHNGKDDVVMVRLEGRKLFVESNGDRLVMLDDQYQLGTVFTVRLLAGGGRIRVYYNDVLKADVPREATGCYFKAGTYTQSNTKHGESAGAFGEVVIYELRISSS